RRSVDGSAPGPEVLGAEPVSCGGTDIAIDVLGSHWPPVALGIEVLEQMLARQVLRAAHDPGDASVDQLEPPLFSRLALEGEAQAGPGDGDMPVTQRGQPEALVVPRIGRIADADH